MALFAISDLHLSLSGEKPMDIFGSSWEDHHLKLKENWESAILNGDTVILGGDLSWAMKLEEAAADFQFIDALPGTKILFKGNHDYWWQSYSKVKAALPQSIMPVQNNYVLFDGTIALCGTRGWAFPGAGGGCREKDEKIYKRELARLELSLEAARRDGLSRFIVTLHYPPFSTSLEDTGFTEIMRRYGVKICIYGHLHGRDHEKAFTGVRDGINYYFTSGDYLGFSPLLLDLKVMEG